MRRVHTYYVHARTSHAATHVLFLCPAAEGAVPSTLSSRPRHTIAWINQTRMYVSLCKVGCGRNDEPFLPTYRSVAFPVVRAQADGIHQAVI